MNKKISVKLLSASNYLLYFFLSILLIVSLIFIDGSHSEAAAKADYINWVRFLVPGGILLIHDVFESEAEGGMAPAMIYHMAKESGVFNVLPKVGTLTALQRL